MFLNFTDNFYSFENYVSLSKAKLWEKYDCRVHWAKLELPEKESEKQAIKDMVHRQYQVSKFIEARKNLDPNGILGNKFIDFLFPIKE